MRNTLRIHVVLFSLPFLYLSTNLFIASSISLLLSNVIEQSTILAVAGNLASE